MVDTTTKLKYEASKFGILINENRRNIRNVQESKLEETNWEYT
jgi:hypothetical protein